MWSDSYRDYVKTLVESNRDTYPYYVAHTCTYWGVSSSSAYPSFKIYFSKEPITANGLYTYIFKDTAVVYSVVGGNANSNYHNNRVSTSSFTGSLKIDDYEFVYTNAEFTGQSIQPDLLSTTNVTQSHFDGFGVVLLIVLLVSMVVKLLRG